MFRAASSLSLGWVLARTGIECEIALMVHGLHLCILSCIWGISETLFCQFSCEINGWHSIVVLLCCAAVVLDGFDEGNAGSLPRESRYSYFARM